MKIWLRELRGEFLTASVLPVLLGTALARHDRGGLDPLIFLLTLAGAVFLHLGTNVANDYFDHRSGNDPANVRYVRPFTGGTRLIQEGLISPGAVLAVSIALFAAGAAIGVVLAVIRTPVILAFAAAGLLSGFFYTAPPLRLAHRGLGEITVGINFGVLIVAGTYLLQTGDVTGECIVASLPLACLIAAVIIINEFQDSEADRIAGKRTLIVRLGTERGVVLFAAVTLLAYLPIIIGAAVRLMPPLSLIGLATLPLAVRAVATARRHHAGTVELAPANALTIQSHLGTGLLLALGYVLS